MKKLSNIEKNVIQDFGDEWNNYNQSSININELKESFNLYFKIFPKKFLSSKYQGFDMGCGSGRWAKLVAPRVRRLNCIDPSDKALKVARKNLKKSKNVKFYNNSVNEKVLKKNSQDFGYCLGVLHHMKSTQEGINSCYKILKVNRPFLIYLYYNLDNKPGWFQIIWRISDIFRKIISIQTFSIKKFVTLTIAIFIYWPLAKLSWILNFLGFNTNNIPLSQYKDRTFYFMKTDALDRFGTKLEKRYSRKEIRSMLKKAGFNNIKFSSKAPYWVVIGWKKRKS